MRGSPRMDSEPVGLTASQLDASVDALSDVLDLIQFERGDLVGGQDAAVAGIR